MQRAQPSRAVKEWLSDYKALSSDELQSFGETITNNEELIASLTEILFDLDNEVMGPVCHQLFELYRSPEISLRRFAMQFIPSLIHVYLEAVANNNKDSSSSIEALLLGIYNLVVSKNWSSTKSTFRIPVLSQPSVYHEKVAAEPGTLTEHALSRYEQKEPRIVTLKPFPVIENITSGSRLLVLSKLLDCYYSDISNMSSDSFHSLCHMATRVSLLGGNTGASSFNTKLCSKSSSLQSCDNQHTPVTRHRRIVVDSRFLLSLLQCLYYVMYNGLSLEVLDTVKLIQARASLELLADVLMVTNAMTNSYKLKMTDAIKDGPMGTSTVSTAPTRRGSITLLTNASFRAKKLPDDITPIVSDDVAPTAAASSKQTLLASISEEHSPDVTEKLEKSFREKGKGIGLKIGNIAKRVEKSRSRKEVGADPETPVPAQNGEVNKADVSTVCRGSVSLTESLEMTSKDKRIIDKSVKKSESFPEEDSKRLHIGRASSAEEGKTANASIKVERSHSEEEKRRSLDLTKHNRSLSEDNNLTSNDLRTWAATDKSETSSMSSSHNEDGRITVSWSADSPRRQTSA